MVTYKDAGVDIEAGYDVIETLRRFAKPSKNVLSNFGGLGGLFSLDLRGYKKPVLVSCADGVGTKLKVAMLAGKHDTVGIDLVAMSANDLVRSGARPLFFIDYIACHKNEKKMMGQVLSGILAGCKQAGCDLLGGETAEMGDMYAPGEYDLAGFCLGIVDKEKMIDGSAIKAGDAVIGLASSGLHSNGYTLARKVLFDIAKLKLTDHLQDLGRTVGEEMLEPTNIYVKPILALLKKVEVKGIAHITGGSFKEKIGRILPKKVKAMIETSSWDPSIIFKIIQKYGKIDRQEMYSAFNMGIGMVVVVDKKDMNRTLSILRASGEEAYVIGNIEKGKGEVEVS